MHCPFAQECERMHERTHAHVLAPCLPTILLHTSSHVGSCRRVCAPASRTSHTCALARVDDSEGACAKAGL
eukprot:13005691-Alexandrium_andersonii.AAC.1